MEGIVSALARHGCRFVVIGSMARRLVGEDVEPADVDVVVDASPASHLPLAQAFAEVGGLVRSRFGWRSLSSAGAALPWDWGFTVHTALGRVDVITRLIDGTTIADHEPHSTLVRLGDGAVARVHPTRHAA